MEIFEFVESGDAEGLKKFVSSGGKVNLSVDGVTALHMAVQSESEEVVSVLVEAKAIVNCATDTGVTPLHLAAQGGNAKAVSVLLKADASPDVQTSDFGVTPLLSALLGGHEDIAIEILTQAKHPINVNAFRTSDGISALLFALDQKLVQISEYLIERGADPNQSSFDGLSPLHCCAERNLVQLAQNLFEKKANIDSARLETLSTPLHTSASCGNVEMVKILMDAGADASLLCSSGMNAFQTAASMGETDVCRLFMEQYDFKDEPMLSNTANGLFLACQSGKIECVELLLGHSSNPNIVFNNGNTSLHICAQKGFSEIVALLLEHSAVIIPNDDKISPVHLAANYGHTKTLEILAAAGGDIEAAADEGEEGLMTPMHFAVEGGHSDTLRFLLFRGATILKRDVPGAVLTVIAGGDAELLQTLISIGVDVDVTNEEGDSALRVAVLHRHEQCAILLLENGANLDFSLISFIIMASCESNMLTLLNLITNNTNIEVSKVSTSDHVTPLHIAAQNGHLSIVEMLLEAGCDPTAVASDTGKIPVDLAEENGHSDVIQLLRQYKSS